MVSYTYFPGKRNRCGDDVPWGVNAQPGKYHEVKLYIKVNTPGMLLSRCARAFLLPERPINCHLLI
jgi:hypothetical protein